MSGRWTSSGIAVLAASALLTGCGKKESAEPAPTSDAAHRSSAVAITSPVGFVWKWEGTRTPHERIGPTDPTKYTVEFLPDTSVVARIDCNRGSGRYKMAGASIAIGPLATTRMACPVGTLETRFVQQLEAARTIYFRGDTLFMDLFADAGTMTFSQMPEPPLR